MDRYEWGKHHKPHGRCARDSIDVLVVTSVWNSAAYGGVYSWRAWAHHGRHSTVNGAIVASVLIDKASDMVKACEILEETRPIFTGGCAAHILNLLLEDVCALPFVAEIRADALEITKYIRDHHALLDQFRTIISQAPTQHRRTLTVPVKTW